MSRAQGILRAAYTRASEIAALRRPLDIVRKHPRVRRLARRHVALLLARGNTWANVDGSLRLLAEDTGRPLVFGPWRGDTATELLYWIPFVRWAQKQFAFDPAALVAVSRGGVSGWYAGACGRYVDLLDHVEESELAKLDSRQLLTATGLGHVPVFDPRSVLELVDHYRGGSAAPRPLMKRSLHVSLTAEPDPVVGELPERYVAIAIGSAPALPLTAARRSQWLDAIRTASSRLPVALLDEEDDLGDEVDVVRPLRGAPLQRRLRAQHAVVAHAAGVVAASPGPAVLGALSGNPAIVLRAADGSLREPDLDIAFRIVTGLRGSLTVLDAGDLGSLAVALGGRPR